MIVVPDEGKKWLLDALLRTEPGDILPFYVRLFKNDADLDRYAVRADFEEANFDGYLPVELVRADWSPSVMNGIRAQTVYGTSFLTWVADSGTQDIYGYIVTDNDDNFVLWGDKFVPPIEVSDVVPVSFSPVMRLRDEEV